MRHFYLVIVILLFSVTIVGCGAENEESLERNEGNSTERTGEMIKRIKYERELLSKDFDQLLASEVNERKETEKNLEIKKVSEEKDEGQHIPNEINEKKATWYVNTTSANVRSGPGVDASVVDVIYYGDKLESTKVQTLGRTPWYNVTVNQEDVWVSSTVVQTEKIAKSSETNESLISNDKSSNHSGATMKYDSADLSITVEPVFTADVRYWISTVTVKNIDQVNSAFAGEKDVFSMSAKEPTSTIAKNNGAVLAVNGAAAGFNDRGFVIRDGVIHRGTHFDEAPLELRNNGSLYIGEYSQRSSDQMLADGTIHTYDYGPVLLRNGSTPNYSSQDWFQKAREPRTAIGQKSSYEYIILTVDGRSASSRGMSYMELVNVYQDLGVNQAYALDGGGSTTLYFDGKVINQPSEGGERVYSDILYFDD